MGDHSQVELLPISHMSNDFNSKATFPYSMDSPLYNNVSYVHNTICSDSIAYTSDSPKTWTEVFTQQ